MKNKLYILSALGLSSGIAAFEKTMNVINILADDLGYGDLNVSGQTKNRES